MEVGNGGERIRRSHEEIRRAVGAAGRVQAEIRKSQLRKPGHSNIFGRMGLVFLSLIHGGLHLSPPNPQDLDQTKIERVETEDQRYKGVFIDLLREHLETSHDPEFWQYLERTPIKRVDRKRETMLTSIDFADDDMFAYGIINNPSDVSLKVQTVEEIMVVVRTPLNKGSNGLNNPNLVSRFYKDLTTGKVLSATFEMFIDKEGKVAKVTGVNSPYAPKTDIEVELAANNLFLSRHNWHIYYSASPGQQSLDRIEASHLTPASASKYTAIPGGGIFFSTEYR